MTLMQKIKKELTALGDVNTDLLVHYDHVTSEKKTIVGAYKTIQKELVVGKVN